MSDKVIIVDKKSGQTPLDCVNQVKKDHPEWKHLPMTYAGRLDPLASGVLLILVGDECLKKDEYLALPKEYEVTVLFGFATDTYDVMGKVIEPSALGAESEEVDEMVWPRSFNKLGARRSEDLSDAFSDEALIKLKDILKNFTGRITQAYPPYSSRTVKGKPLFQWAREDKLDEITIPAHDVFVESINVVDLNDVSGSALYAYIKEIIAGVSGDFRQVEILRIWSEELGEKSDLRFKTITLRIVCGSGVYVRSIAHELGAALGMPALALKIVRTKVGEYILG